MKEIVFQLCMAFCGTLGFCILFHLRRKYMFLASLGGLCTWGVYLIGTRFSGDVFWPCLWAATFAGTYGETLARIRKAPSSTFFLPAVIPLIPGSNLYYTLFYIVNGEASLARENAIKTGKYALAIAIGISLVSSLLYMWHRIPSKSGQSNSTTCFRVHSGKRLR